MSQTVGQRWLIAVAMEVQELMLPPGDLHFLSHQALLCPDFLSSWEGKIRELSSYYCFHHGAHSESFFYYLTLSELQLNEHIRHFFSSFAPRVCIFFFFWNPPSFVSLYFKPVREHVWQQLMLFWRSHSLVARMIYSSYEGFHCCIDCSKSLAGNIMLQLRLPNWSSLAAHFFHIVLYFLQSLTRRRYMFVLNMYVPVYLGAELQNSTAAAW